MLCARSGQPHAWYHISYLNTRESRSLPPRAHRGSSSEGLLVELPVAGTARRLQWRTKDTRVLRPLRLATRATLAKAHDALLMVRVPHHAGADVVHRRDAIPTDGVTSGLIVVFAHEVT